jgi:uncharacterized Zn finger protein (UPF0148 family)
MTLYSRSDVCSIAIPQPDGCGASHQREVTRGVPAKIFKIDCPPCEAYLRGDRKPKILRYQTNPKTGQVTHQERIADADPMWSSTPDTVPLTPDETRTNAVRSERGRMQIEMLQALAALRSTGIEVPPEALWLLERELPAGVLQGTVVCANSHDVPSGSAFCPQCGVTMAARAAVEAPAAGPAVDLGRLHPQTLRKMCREAKLPDRGSKDVLIQRLQAA